MPPLHLVSARTSNGALLISHDSQVFVFGLLLQVMFLRLHLDLIRFMKLELVFDLNLFDHPIPCCLPTHKNVEVLFALEATEDSVQICTPMVVDFRFPVVRFN